MAANLVGAISSRTREPSRKDHPGPGHLSIRQQLLTRNRATSYVVYVRIGGPARKHGISVADIWHAVRNAMRRVVMAEDLTMLIGPAANGSLLEIGVLDIEGDDPVVIHDMALRPTFHRFLG